MFFETVRRFRRAPHCFVALLLTALLAPFALAAEKPKELADFGVIAGSAWQVGPTIVSGQPTEETLRGLAERGITTIICLRSDRELADRKAVPFDEPALAKSLGLEFVHVPLGTSWHYTPQALEKISAALQKSNGKALLHCTVGFRATTAWTAYRTGHAAVPLDEALTEGRQMGLGVDNIGALLGQKVEWRLTGEPLEPAPGWLVDGPWLAEHGAEKNVRILDTRPSYIAYFEGHAKGATHFDPHALRGPSNGVPAQFRSIERMAEAFALAGATPAQRVVVYADGADILSATMAMYALEKLGHLNTSLLDGGIAAVQSAGLISQEYPTPPAAPPTPPAPAAAPPIATAAPAPAAPKAPSPPAFDAIDNFYPVATLADVEAALASRDALFVDARPPEQYSGATRVWQRNGHIPGAVNVFWKRLTADDNTSRLRPRAEIERIFAEAGVTPDKNIIVYCGTGREATLIYMYLTRELGYPDVRLFEGAWTLYSAEHRLPVEN